MSDETQPEAAKEAVPTALEPGEVPAPARLTSPPVVPRPRPATLSPPRKPTLGASSGPLSSSIPPPAPMPRVPGMDAFMAAPSAATPAAASPSIRPPLSTLEETDSGWATPAPATVLAEVRPARRRRDRAIRRALRAANRGAP
jgi:hypothetical protein